MVRKLVENGGKASGKWDLYTAFWNMRKFTLKFARVLLVDLHGVLHKLSIDFLLDFFDLVAESEV